VYGPMTEFIAGFVYKPTYGERGGGGGGGGGELGGGPSKGLSQELKDTGSF